MPFYFIYNPAILLEGSWYATIKVILLTMLALYLMSAGMEGWLSRRLNQPMRGLYILAGILLIYPHLALDITGIILGSALLAYAWLQNRREKETPALIPIDK